MSSPGTAKKKLLILGIGNTLLQDDGAGVHVTQSLKSTAESNPDISIIDGGTLGLSLLPEIEDAAGLIVVDAGEIGGKAGDIKVFENEAMDHQLSGVKSTVHELAVSDLLAAATLRGRQPESRALVAIQPECTEWGLLPTEKVRQAIPRACEMVNVLVWSWNS